MNTENYETNAAPVERDPRGANAQRHGILSEHVPPAERPAYLAHVEAVRASSGARGYLQERLAERAALALWRLDRVARFEAAESASEQRRVLQGISEAVEYGHAGAVTKAFNRLHRMVGESAACLRADPSLSEAEALRLEGTAAHLEALAAGHDGAGLSDSESYPVGYMLGTYLQTVKVTPGEMVQAMTGRKPKAGDVEAVECGDWEYEAEELPGLVSLWRARLPEMGDRVLLSLALTQRERAAGVRAAALEAQHVKRDALNLAALPSGEVLEKVTRYEAHLERVLYRALHDLEAARRQDEGQDTPGPLRGVVDAGERHA